MCNCILNMCTVQCHNKTGVRLHKIFNPPNKSNNGLNNKDSNKEEMNLKRKLKVELAYFSQS